MPSSTTGLRRPLLDARSCLLSARLVGFALFVSPQVSAQQPMASMRGTVTDTLGRPVTLAQVILSPNGGQTQTDSLGHFLIANLRPAKFHMTVRRLGFAPVFVDVEIRRPGESNARIVLSPVGGGLVRLDTVAVVAPAMSSPDLIAFYERRAAGIGQFITPTQIEARKGSTFTDLLRSYASRLRYVRRVCSNGFAIVGADAPRDLNAGQKLSDGGRCVMDQACYVQIFLNGVRVYWYDRSTLPPNVDEYQTGQIEAVEVYHGGAETPSQFGGTGAACGTIAIWLKR
jgi:hypothetical protein